MSSRLWPVMTDDSSPTHERMKLVKNYKNVFVRKVNMKNSEKADTSTSSFVMWCWPYDKVKNTEVIQSNVTFWQILWSVIFKALSISLHSEILTPPRNRGGVIFSFQFVCMSVCVYVCVCVCVSSSACEQNSNRTDEPIWTRFSLHGCLPLWLKPYWNWWPSVKGQGHSDVIPIFSS